MGKSPFHEDLDDTFRGVRVRVHTDEHSYEGWCGRWHYNEHGVIIYDAERDDGEHVEAVTLSDPETVERLSPMEPIEELRVVDVAPSPYTYRSMDDAAHEKFVKLTRERGHLLTYPTVRPVAEDDQRDHDRAYEVVAGHRRFETAQRAGLETIVVQVADLDAWEAVERFVDDHVAIQGGDERHMYGQEELDRMLARLREDWADDRLREIPVLRRIWRRNWLQHVEKGYAIQHHAIRETVKSSALQRFNTAQQSPSQERPRHMSIRVPERITLERADDGWWVVSLLGLGAGSYERL